VALISQPTKAAERSTMLAISTVRHSFSEVGL
jgi:hypothetical protein